VLAPEAEAANSLFFRGFSAAERGTFIELMHRALHNLEVEDETQEGMYA
jgi:hypothetical protein